MKFFKISFLVGLHVCAVVGPLAAIDLTVHGKHAPTIAFVTVSALIATALALWWIVQIAKHSAETKERIKKCVDVVSLAFLVVGIGVSLRIKLWPEPPRVLGHLPIEVEILLWDLVPFSFGLIWLIARYANALAEKYPFLFHRGGRPGLLFYFAQFVVGLAFLENLFAFPDWVLTLLWITLLGGFCFAFRQGLRDPAKQREP
jgi:hypothetical protein